MMRGRVNSARFVDVVLGFLKSTLHVELRGGWLSDNL